MKLWVDDVRPAPVGYIWSKSVYDASCWIIVQENRNEPFEIISIDHDAGEYAKHGGDYIKLLDWLEETGRSYPIHLHTMNPVGMKNMRRIIEKKRMEGSGKHMTFHNYLVDIEGHFGNIARVTVTACDKTSAIEEAKAYLLNNLHHTLVM